MLWAPLRSIFRRDSLCAGQVASWLQVGPALDGPGYLRLRLQGVTHVVDLRDERCDDPDEMDGLGLRWRRLGIAEADAPTPRQIADLVRWLDAEADEVPNASLYLHGAAGRGRTATVAIALLMHQDATHRGCGTAGPGGMACGLPQRGATGLSRRPGREPRSRGRSTRCG